MSLQYFLISYFSVSYFSFKLWTLLGSNQRPLDYESSALTV